MVYFGDKTPKLHLIYDGEITVLHISNDVAESLVALGMNHGS